jgi:hypothetical protein
LYLNDLLPFVKPTRNNILRTNELVHIIYAPTAVAAGAIDECTQYLTTISSWTIVDFQLLFVAIVQGVP